MNKLILLCVLLVSTAFAGFRQTNFLDTRIKKHSISAPVLTNEFCHSYKWNSFVNDIVLGSSWRREDNGTEIATVLSRYSMSLRNVATNISFWDEFYGDPTLVGARDFRISNGDIFFLLPKDEYSEIQFRPATNHSAVKRRYNFPGAVVSFDVLNDWVGGKLEKWLIVATSDGEINAIDLQNDWEGKKPVRSRVPNGGRGISGMRSDGKSGLSNNFTIFAWSSGVITSSPIWRISFSPIERAFGFTAILPRVSGTPGGSTPTSVPTMSRIADLFQFWVGSKPEDYRLIARLSNNNFVSMNSDGQVIEFPIVTSVNSGRRNVPSIPVGDIRSVATCNNRTTWKYCSDLMMFENFSKPGQGIRRMSWVPDGYIYNLPLEVSMKDVSQEGNISKPMLIIRNLSTWKSAKGITVRIWHAKSEYPDQSIQSDLYYSYIPGVMVRDGVSPENGNITYTDLIFPDDFELDPGEETLKDGIQLGIHFYGYYPGVWDKGNDWSWLKTAGNQYSPNDNISVYLRGADGTLGQIAGTNPPANFVSAPKVFTTKSSLGFETLDYWDYPLPLVLSNKRTEGSYGLEVQVNGYNVLKSQPFTLASDVSAMSLDVLVGLKQTNPYWVGQISASIDLIGLNMENQYIGEIPLSMPTDGSFKTYNFSVPQYLASFMRKGAKVRFKFNINGNLGSDPLIIDNLKLK